MIRVKVPATTANLGPGFDTLGMALPLFMDVRAETTGDSGVKGSQNGNSPGLIAAIITRMLEEAGGHTGFKLEVQSAIPIARGLGSSAAAIISGLLLGNEMAGLHLNQQEILKRAVALEGHPDNVVPALVGGFTTALVSDNDVYYQRVRVPEGIRALIAVPEYTLDTARARRVLPETLTLNQGVYNLQRACYLLAAFANRDLSGVREALQDCWHQPYRQPLVPGLAELTAAMNRLPGVLGVTLSGAGPSMLALLSGEEERARQVMTEVLRELGIAADIYLVSPCEQGARLGGEE